MFARYLLALSLTLVVEGCVAYLAGLRGRLYTLAFAMINVITNPILNYLILILGYLGIDATFALVVILEMLVIIVEWRLLLYAFGDQNKGRLLVTSVLANTTSFLVGWLLFWT